MDETTMTPARRPSFRSDLFEIVMERCINNMMKVITSDESFKDYVRNFDGNQGFMWDKDPRKYAIGDAVDSDGHSGASFAICLRECQRRLQQS